MKSNVEYLREAIDNGYINLNNGNDANEWIDAVLNDHEEDVNELKDEISKLESKIEKLEKELELATEYPEEINYEEIDCGIGIIKYLEPDNLKLQVIMEDFKEKMERKALFA